MQFAPENSAFAGPVSTELSTGFVDKEMPALKLVIQTLSPHPPTLVADTGMPAEMLE